MKSVDKDRLRQRMAEVCLVVLLCLSITAPDILISQALPYFKIEQLLLPVVLTVYLWFLLAGIARPLRLNGLFLVGLLYFICNILSLAYGASILGHTVGLRDFYELPKVWLPVAFFTIAFEARLSEAALRRLLSWFSFAVLLVCVYAWAQFLGLPFTYKLNAFYASADRLETSLAYAGRVFATVGNPNELGGLMTWCIVLFVLAALSPIGRRLQFSLVAFACLITLIMTGSRYGLLTFIVGVLMILAPSPFSPRRSLPRLVLALVLLPLVAWTYLTVAHSNTRTLQRYQTLSDPLQIDSLRQRVDQLWPIAWADFSKSPIVGHGPGKYFLSIGVPDEGIIDSEFLDVLREKGILGFTVFLGYYLYPLYLIRRGQRAARAIPDNQHHILPANRMLVRAAFIIGVLALLMDIGMSTFYTLYLQGLLWLWLGLGARSAVTVYESVQLARFAIPDSRTLQPRNTSMV